MIRSDDKPSFIYRAITWVGVLLCSLGVFVCPLQDADEVSREHRTRYNNALDVQIEVLLGFLLSLFGVVGASGKLQPAKVTDIVSNKDFDVYDHRSDLGYLTTALPR